MYQFTEDCYIGITEIDKEHKYLFKLINGVIKELESEKINFIETTGKLLFDLGNYACTHFAHEEEYMKSIEDPELPQQQREHREFENKVKELLSMKEYTRKSLEDIAEFLVRWLYHHILSSDMMIGKIVKKDENPYEFTAKYHTGIQMIDDEHKVLFQILEQTDNLIHDELIHDKYDVIVDILNELKEYTQKHFSDEEIYMEKINYPGLEAQKRAHSAFIDKIDAIDYSKLKEIDEKQQEYLLQLQDFLAGWLVNHILNMDKLISC